MPDLPDLVVFDCDGVLVDSEAIYIESELEHLASVGVRFERAEYMGRFMGLTPMVWEERIAVEVESLTGATLPADFFATLYERERQVLEEGLSALPGASMVVDSLEVRSCVASSSRMVWLNWKLERTGLLELFHPHVFSAELVARGKPEPDLFLHAAEVMGAEPSRTVVIEDSVNGVIAGKAAGMRVIGFTGGGHCLEGHGDLLFESGADVILDSLLDIPLALAELEDVD